MKLIRIIPKEQIENEVLTLHNFGFTLIWKATTLEVWL